MLVFSLSLLAFVDYKYWIASSSRWIKCILFLFLLQSQNFFPLCVPNIPNFLHLHWHRSSDIYPIYIYISLDLCQCNVCVYTHIYIWNSVVNRAWLIALLQLVWPLAGCERLGPRCCASTTVRRFPPAALLLSVVPAACGLPVSQVVP